MGGRCYGGAGSGRRYRGSEDGGRCQSGGVVGSFRGSVVYGRRGRGGIDGRRSADVVGAIHTMISYVFLTKIHIVQLCI